VSPDTLARRGAVQVALSLKLAVNLRQELRISF